MASIGDKKATVSVYVNAEEAKKTLESMKNSLKEGSELIKIYKKELAKLGQIPGSERTEDENKRIAALEDSIKKLSKSNSALSKTVTENERALTDFDSLIGRIDKVNLKNLYKDLREAKNSFKLIASDDMAALEKGRNVISSIQASIKKLETGYVGLDKVMKNLKTTPLNQLKLAQEELMKKIAETTRGTKEYRQANEQLKAVNAQINSVTSAFNNQDSAIVKTMKRLASYVAVYMGFNQVIGKMKEVVSSSLQLSDSMADIQKVTKMTGGQVDELAKSIDRIDTRSAQSSLYQLGYSAGMLGLHTNNEILGFIKAADQMNWALKELGDDGAVRLMKVAMLTGDLKKNGGDVESTLLKVGSAINELTANSAASAGPVVDFVSRMGSIGSVCHYSSAELVGIASTLDALNVNAEMGGTAMNKFMASIANDANLSALADKLGVTDTEIKNAGGSMEQMIYLLQKLQEQGDGGMQALEPFFADLGSDGTRLKQVITTLVQNVDELSAHVTMARDAYDEGVSATNEFEVKNETAAATFARLGNSIRENLVNSGMVRWLQQVGQYLLNVYNYAERHLVILAAIRSALYALYGYFAGTFVKGIITTFPKVATMFTSFVGILKTVKDTFAKLQVSMIAYSVAQKSMNAAARDGVIVNEEEALRMANLAVAQGAATTSTITLTGAMKALQAAFVANPVTAFLGVIVAVIGAISGLVSVLWEEDTATKAQNEAMENATDTMMEESVAINQKYELLKQSIEAEDELRKKLAAATAAGQDTTVMEQQLKLAEAEHKHQLDNVNSASSTYTGWLLKTTSSVDDVTRSQNQLNAALRETQALMVKNAMMEAGQDLVKDTMKSETADLRDNLEDMAENMKVADDKIGAFVGSAYAKIITLAQQGKTVTQITGQLRTLAKEYGATSYDYDSNNKQIRRSLESITEAMGAMQQITKSADQAYKTTMNDIQKENKQVYEGQMKDLYNQLNDSWNTFWKAAGKTGKDAAYAQYSATYDKLLAISSQAGIAINKGFTSQMEKIKKAHLDVSLQIDNNTKKTAADIRSEIKSTDLSVDESVAQLKRINDILGLHEDNPQFLKSANEILGTTYTDAKKARVELTALGQEVRAYQKNSLHVNDTGHVLQPTSGGSSNGKSQEQQVRKEMQELFNYLNAYYTEEANKLRQKRKDNPLLYSESEMNDELRKNEESYQKAIEQLCDYLLNTGDDIKKNGGFLAFLSDKSDMEKVKNDVLKYGKNLWDDLTKNMTKSQKEQLESTIKHINELEKIAKKYDYVQQAEDDFRNNLVKYQLYNEEQFDVMKEWARKREEYTAKDLQKAFGLNETNAAALLVLLNDFNASEEEAIKKQNEKIAKLVKLRFMATEKAYTDQEKEQEAYVKMAEELQNMGIGVDKTETKEEIELIKIKIDKQREYIDVLRQSLEAEWTLRLGYTDKLVEAEQEKEDRINELTSEGASGDVIYTDPEILAIQARIDAMKAEVEAKVNASQQMTEAQQNYISIQEQLVEKEAELQQERFQWVNEYTDVVTEGIDSIVDELTTEGNTWADTGKTILNSMAKTTASMIGEWMKRKMQEAAIDKAKLAAKKATATAEAVVETTKNQTVTVSNASSNLADLGVESATTTGKAATGLSKAISKILGELGPWGAPLIAVVTALISGGLAVAISKITKAKSDVTEATGVSETEAASFTKKKVAAGMLTYAEGNYPVLGADGQVYDATRVNSWQTGVYSTPHYGILGEKGPELIVDGQTTNKMMTLRPDLYSDILALRDGIIQRNVRNYAQGQYPASTVVGQRTSDTNLLQVIASMEETNRQLRETLERGIGASIVEDFSRDGVINTQEQNRKWMAAHGLLRS